MKTLTVGPLICETAFSELDKEKGLLVHRFYSCRLVNKPEVVVGSFILAPMPGCCGVVISTETYVSEQFRGQVFAADNQTQTVAGWMQQLKKMAAEELGYAIMLATTDVTNLKEIFSAKNGGWRFLGTFDNPRTGNKLALMYSSVKTPFKPL